MFLSKDNIRTILGTFTRDTAENILKDLVRIVFKIEQVTKENAARFRTSDLRKRTDCSNSLSTLLLIPVEGEERKPYSLIIRRTDSGVAILSQHTRKMEEYAGKMVDFKILPFPPVLISAKDFYEDSEKAFGSTEFQELSNFRISGQATLIFTDTFYRRVSFHEEESRREIGYFTNRNTQKAYRSYFKGAKVMTEVATEWLKDIPEIKVSK